MKKNRKQRTKNKQNRKNQKRRKNKVKKKLGKNDNIILIKNIF